MTSLSLQHFIRLGRALGRDPAVLRNAAQVIRRIRLQNPRRAVVFSLAHLAILARVPYLRLRAWIGRRGNEPYREFFVAKKRRRRKLRLPIARRGKRRIAVPAPLLMRQQRWILHRVLHTASAHEASVAFHKNADLVEAARLHCQCRWLIKMDIENFFESIFEPAVFKVFVDLGYPRLLAFELTRLCTRVVPDGVARRTARHRDRGHAAYAYQEDDAKLFGVAGPKMALGSLPQGAPTSPLLANLAVRGLDESIQEVADNHGLTYTRYADDIALSTSRSDFTKAEGLAVIAQVFRQIEKARLSPNHAKTQLVTPGAAKIVLGLSVGNARPALTRTFKNSLRLHAHMMGKRKIAPSAHAKALKFRSVLSMRRHIQGKLEHARRVDSAFAKKIETALANVDWTL